MTLREAELAAWVMETQASEWDALLRAFERAANRTWSLEAGWHAHTIAQAARLVGPTPWGEVSYSLVRGGVYQALLRRAGVEVPDISEWELLETDQIMRGHGIVGEAAVERYSASIKAMLADSLWEEL